MDIKTSCLLVKLLVIDAKMPMKAHSTDAGFDISSINNYTVMPWTRELVKTGISIEVPKGTYGRLAPRSGLAWKNGIHVGAGVIDEGYTGEVGVVLFNLSDEKFEIKKGDRIAQLIFEEIRNINTTKCIEQSPTTTNTTQRGEGGFGSTDQKSISTKK